MYLTRNCNSLNSDILEDLESFFIPKPGASSSPQLDMRADENGYVIKADLPGVKKEEIEITLTGNVLSLKGERKGETEKSEKGWYHSERWSGSFERQIEFPVDVDTAKVQASFKDGVLEITVPKSESARPKQLKIDVK